MSNSSCIDVTATSEQLCYIPCNFCNIVLAVSVPCSSLFDMVTVTCGHCTNLWSVNMGMAAAFHQSLSNSNSTSQDSTSHQHAQVTSYSSIKAPLTNTSNYKVDLGSSSKYNSNRMPMRPSAVSIPTDQKINRVPEKKQRVPSAYNQFIKEEIQRIKANNPDISHREAFSTAAKNWAHFPHIQFGLMLEANNHQAKFDEVCSLMLNFSCFNLINEITVVGSIISENQLAFIANRNITDGPLIVNEIISWCKRVKYKALIVKLDFEKAYDTVDWDFLLSVLDQMNFPERWVLWVKGVLVSSRASVLVNGSPTKEFQFSRGLRQGDPLSPFQFLVVMEGFSWLFERAGRVGVFSGLPIPNGGPMISNLLFADDALIMGKWSEENVKNLSRLLRAFYLVSGLKVNLKKKAP
ncbi:hypothetical protein SSX86_021424 [Deinandra increscens subsp. villosa]|uniref:Reverse transcriptase domain-containing protein n=1 Tax=Deinandra increscens subsp. villosa TaxID=3103831 RepID=A0AAP0GRP9_9ASTR